MQQMLWCSDEGSEGFDVGCALAVYQLARLAQPLLSLSVCLSVCRNRLYTLLQRLASRTILFSVDYSTTCYTVRRTRNSADAEIARHEPFDAEIRPFCRQSAELHIFHAPLVEFRIFSRIYNH